MDLDSKGWDWPRGYANGIIVIVPPTAHHAAKDTTMNSAQAMRMRGVWQRVSILAVAGTSTLLTSCQDLGWGRVQMPTTTRTGVVREVVILDTASPSVIIAHPGDEIRWINKRQGAAKVVFLDPVEAQLSCRAGFGSWRGANPNQFAADIGPNKSASVCFKTTQKAKYLIEADSTRIRSEQSMQGAISIESFSAPLPGY